MGSLGQAACRAPGVGEALVGDGRSQGLGMRREQRQHMAGAEAVRVGMGPGQCARAWA